MRIVVALGGNALLGRREAPDVAIEAARATKVAVELAELAQKHQLVITHGNGPQVGTLAVESVSDSTLAKPYPLDVLVAETQGMIGYWLVQALENQLGLDRRVAGVISQVVVHRDDPAFADPTKFVGAVYTARQAAHIAHEHDWTVRRDGDGWRRVVASPQPQAILEEPLIRLLLDQNATVVCMGGGGIPVAFADKGEIAGVEAVVDKDLTAALLAERVRAHVLLILTDVPAVELDYGMPKARAIADVTPIKLRAHHFATGSMGPKVEAAARFVERTNGTAAIGALDQVSQILQGRAGTIVRPDGEDIPSSIPLRDHADHSLGPDWAVTAPGWLLEEAQ